MTTDKIHYDNQSTTFSIPKALEVIPCLSWTEKKIIARIISLTNKYHDKGGCSLTNKKLAERHRCAVATVSQAISKATKLGLLKSRRDELKKHENKDGTTSVTQKRNIQMTIPQMWEMLGALWAEFYFVGDKNCQGILDWVDEEFKSFPKDNDFTWIINFAAKLAYQLNSRGYLENLKGVDIKLEEALDETRRTPIEESNAFMFRVLDVLESKCFGKVNVSSKDIPSTSFELEMEDSPEQDKKKLPVKYIKYSRQFYKTLRKENKIKEISTDMTYKGADTLDKLVRIDKWDFNTEIIPAIEWALKDDFWSAQILSLAPLRNKSKNTLSKFNNLYTSYHSCQKGPSKITPKVRRGYNRAKTPYEEGISEDELMKITQQQRRNK